MKRVTTALYSVLYLAFAAQSQDIQKQSEFVKEKHISKSYKAKDKCLMIDNKFGDVKIIPWNRNEIKVDIHITATATEEGTAWKMFNAINVLDSQVGDTISFVTKTAQVKNTLVATPKTATAKECKDCKSKMTINYEVNLPVNTPLEIKNSFGAIELPDYPGLVSLESRYGSLTTGSLSKVKNIFVANGKARIKGLKDGDCTFKWGDVEINKLSGRNLLLFNTCSSNLVISKVSTDLYITETYSTINIQPPLNFPCEYLIDSRYGKFKNTSNIVFTTADAVMGKVDDRVKKYCSASSNGASKVLVTSSYGEIIISGRAADLQ